MLPPHEPALTGDNFEKLEEPLGLPFAKRLVVNFVEAVDREGPDPVGARLDIVETGVPARLGLLLVIPRRRRIVVPRIRDGVFLKAVERFLWDGARRADMRACVRACVSAMSLRSCSLMKCPNVLGRTSFRLSNESGVLEYLIT